KPGGVGKMMQHHHDRYALVSKQTQKPMVVFNRLWIKHTVRCRLKFTPHQAHSVMRGQRRDDLSIFLKAQLVVCGAVEYVTVARLDSFPVMIDCCFNLVGCRAGAELKA